MWNQLGSPGVSILSTRPRRPGPGAMTDEPTLIARARDGDVDAWGEVVRRHQDVARRVAAAAGGIDLAEDSVQDGFVRAFRSLARYDDARPFLPWLLTIVANAARNQHRAVARWDRTRRRAPAHFTATYVPSAESAALDSESNRDLVRAIGSLSRRHAEVVTYRYLMELSEEETAAGLGIPRGTVKSRLARALDRLETLLQED